MSKQLESTEIEAMLSQEQSYLFDKVQVLVQPVFKAEGRTLGASLWRLMCSEAESR